MLIVQGQSSGHHSLGHGLYQALSSMLKRDVGEKNAPRLRAQLWKLAALDSNANLITHLLCELGHVPYSL